MEPAKESLIKPWHYLLIGIFIGVSMTAIGFMISLPPQGKAIEIIPAPVSLVSVHIDGEVNQPGVYQLPDGSRVQDVITASGGSTELGNVNSVNLARLLEDGDKITIPSKNQTEESTTSLVNINLADAKQLDSLPGIGETRAKAIIEYRNEHGFFLSISDITKIPGITQDTYNGLKDLITIQ